MGMYSHKDGRLVLLPQIGAPTTKIAQPFLLKAGTKVTFDPGGKASYAKGFAGTPYAIVTGSAEPKLDIDVSDAKEVWDACAWCGGIGAGPITVSHVFSRIGLPTTVFLFIGGVWETGGGYSSDDAAGVADKISFKVLDVWRDGKSIYA